MVEIGTGEDPLTEGGEPLHLSLEASMALIGAQREEAARRLSVDPVPIVAAWGVAWLVGFGAIYLASSRGPGPYLPTWMAAVVLGSLFALAIGISVGQGARRGRGVAGPSRQVGAMYGWTWLLAMAGLFAVNLGLAHQGLPSDLRQLAWSGSALLVVGLMYLATGIIWLDRVQYGLGAWTLLVGAASVSAGVPANFAVLSLAGGGGFLVAAGVSQAIRRRRRASTTS